MGKDKRSKEEKKDWDKGKFTKAEAKEAGMSQKEMNKARAEQERELGNPLAPPED